jgi:exodeoxyribonuclease VII small subunit
MIRGLGMNTQNKINVVAQASPLDMLSYEQAFSELEDIVAALELNNESLESAMALFERGQALARRCSDLLDQAEMKIQQISGGELVDFIPEG